MRSGTFRLFRAVFIIAVIFAAVGLMRGWFYFTRPNDLDNSKVNVQFTVDTTKVKDDSAKVKNAAAEVGDKVAGEARHLQNKVTHHDASPVTPPAPLEPPTQPVPVTSGAPAPTP